MEKRSINRKRFGKTVLVVTSLGLLAVTQNHVGIVYPLVSLGATGLCVLPSVPMGKKMSKELEEYKIERDKELEMTLSLKKSNKRENL